MTIMNERQFLASQAHRRRLLTAREHHLAHPQKDALAQEWLLAGVDRLLLDVEAELAEYTTTTRSGPIAIEVAEIAAVPEALARARLAAGLSQRELASRLGVSEQQVQKDEAGAYARASLARLAHVAHTLGLRLTLALQPGDTSPTDTSEASAASS